MIYPSFGPRRVSILLLALAILSSASSSHAQDKEFGTDCLINRCVPAGDIDPATPSDYSSRATAYAELMWQNFLALSFPAEIIDDGSNPPHPVPVPSDVDDLFTSSSNPAVWSIWSDAHQLIPGDGSEPTMFGSERLAPISCSPGGDVPVPTYELIADEYVQADQMGPVVDQQGQYVRFAMTFNEHMHRYVVDNALYNLEGQAAFSDGGNEIDWPRGIFSPEIPGSQPGSIFVKATYKILTPEDDSSQFYTIRGFVYNAEGGAFGDQPTVAESCQADVEMGLVALHITRRTNSAPQWLWATFEHIDNAPSYEQVIDGTFGPWNFFDTNTCPLENGKPSCAFNTQPPQPWNPDIADQSPTQIIRQFAIGEVAQQVNLAFQTTYLDSIWSKYQLIDVQFPTVVKVVNAQTGLATINPAYPDGVPSPTYLTNSTIETYRQGFNVGETTSNGDTIPSDDVTHYSSGNPIEGLSGGAQRMTSNCVGCHGDANMQNGHSSGTVYALDRAVRADTALQSDTVFNPYAAIRRHGIFANQEYLK